MKPLRAALALSAISTAALSTIVAVDQASASTLIVGSTSVVYPSPSPVLASLHLASPAVAYSSVYVSPQYLNGTLDGTAVQLFAYCVDILDESGSGTFNVVSLMDYLGGNATKYNELASLIAAAGGPTSKTSDAAAQAAIWELMYETSSFNLSSGNFSMGNVQNDSALLSDANSLLANAVSNAGRTGANLQLYVATNSNRQDMLFWTVSPVPEPSSWAMMLIGFGLVGGAMGAARRKKEALIPVA